VAAEISLLEGGSVAECVRSAAECVRAAEKGSLSKGELTAKGVRLTAEWPFSEGRFVAEGVRLVIGFMTEF